MDVTSSFEAAVIQRLDPVVVNRHVVILISIKFEELIFFLIFRLKLTHLN